MYRFFALFFFGWPLLLIASISSKQTLPWLYNLSLPIFLIGLVAYFFFALAVVLAGLRRILKLQISVEWPKVVPGSFARIFSGSVNIELIFDLKSDSVSAR